VTVYATWRQQGNFSTSAAYAINGVTAATINHTVAPVSDLVLNDPAGGTEGFQSIGTATADGSGQVQVVLTRGTSWTPVDAIVFVSMGPDSDGDGMPDGFEKAFTDPPSATALNPGDDLDTDGLTNLQEYVAGTLPNNPDTDGDTLMDGPELAGAGARPPTDPLKADTDGDGLYDDYESNTGIGVDETNTGTNPTLVDTDADALRDGVETNTGTYVNSYNTGTNPLVADSDSDGAGDWYEVTAAFTNPNSNTSKPNIPYPLPDPDGSTGATNKPVKVYIMSGQSNMVGAGTVSGTGDGTLETMTLRQNKFPNLVTSSGAWTAREDVYYRGVISATADKKLGPGCGSGSGTIGPELGFGHVMGWFHDEGVLLLKSSIGNRALGWDILPAGSARYDFGGYTYCGSGDAAERWAIGTSAPVWTSGGWYAGYEWDRFFRDESEWIRPHDAVVNVVDILDKWSTEHYGSTGKHFAGRDFQIAGFVWWQGERDAGDAGHSSRYEQNLVYLINSLRSYYSNRYPGKVVPNAPFVLATLGETDLNSPPSNSKTVFDAMMAVDGGSGKYPQFAGNVKTVYSNPLSEGGSGNSHYGNRAGTYMLVGDAMGRAMVELQGSTSPTGFASWQAANDATGQTLDDDHDNDGVPNGIEWFLKGSNNSSGFTALPGVAKDPVTGALSVTWTKDSGYTGSYPANFVVETSDSLTGAWAAEPSPGTVTLTGNEVKYTFPTPLDAKRFARLKVTGP
jgi:hypothetical protein